MDLNGINQKRDQISKWSNSPSVYMCTDVKGVSTPNDETPRKNTIGRVFTRLKSPPSANAHQSQLQQQ